MSFLDRKLQISLSKQFVHPWTSLTFVDFRATGPKEYLYASDLNIEVIYTIFGIQRPLAIFMTAFPGCFIILIFCFYSWTHTQHIQTRLPMPPPKYHTVIRRWLSSHGPS